VIALPIRMALDAITLRDGSDSSKLGFSMLLHGVVGRSTDQFPTAQVPDHRIGMRGEVRKAIVRGWFWFRGGS